MLLIINTYTGVVGHVSRMPCRCPITCSDSFPTPRGHSCSPHSHLRLIFSSTACNTRGKQGRDAGASWAAADCAAEPAWALGCPRSLRLCRLGIDHGERPGGWSGNLIGRGLVSPPYYPYYPYCPYCPSMTVCAWTLCHPTGFRRLPQ